MTQLVKTNQWHKVRRERELLRDLTRFKQPKHQKQHILPALPSKISVAISSTVLQTLLLVLMEPWIYYFGATTQNVIAIHRHHPEISVPAIGYYNVLSQMGMYFVEMNKPSQFTV